MSPATLRVKRGDTLSRVFAWQELDAAGMLAMQQALTFHGLACHNRSQALRTLIDGATDGQSLSLAAANLVTGWPA